jgi:hypothetical protein
VYHRGFGILSFVAAVRGSMMTCRLSIRVAVSAALALVAGRAAVAGEYDWLLPDAQLDAESLACAEKYVQAILDYQPQDSRADPREWWFDVFDYASKQFWMSVYEAGVDATVVQVMGKFGQEGPEADLRLMLGGAPVLLPDRQGLITIDLVSRARERNRHRLALWRAVQLRAAQAQVRLFTKRPELFERFYHMVLWSGLVFGPEGAYSSFGILYHDLQNDIRAHVDDEYWWYARLFLILQRAAPVQERSAKDLKPEELYNQYVTWSAAIGPQIKYLYPIPGKLRWGHSRLDAWMADWNTRNLDLPDTPFDDWPQDRKPPSAFLMRGFVSTTPPKGIEELVEKEGRCGRQIRPLPTAPDQDQRPD